MATTTTGMYTLPSIVADVVARPRPNIVYEIRNIHDDEARRREEGDDGERANTKMPDAITDQSPLPEFGALETRQEEILNQLAELKKQVSTLRSFLKPSSLETAEKKPQCESSEKEIAKDCVSQKAIDISLVVNVNPSRPPYSIYALQKIWKDINVKVKTYIHSNVTSQIPVTFDSSSYSTSKNVIKLLLIYKNVKDLETVTGLHNYPIVGEVNFLRYLSRLTDTHNYESNNVAFTQTTDNILDSCHHVHCQTSRDATNKAVSALHNELKETHWNGKGEPNIADIAAWSTIKWSSSIKLPQFLHEWYERCEKVFTDGKSTS